MAPRWALITGTSTGIGRATALGLLRQGENVVAGVRRKVDADSLVAEAQTLATRAPASGRLVPVLLDVTDPTSLATATDQIRQTIGTSGLWALINNAGVVVPGPVETVALADWRRQFEVNFFGVIALTQAMLPLLRRGVEAHGPHVPRLMIVSSIGGRVAQPINAPYTASKWATTALGDALRLELRRQAIGVTVLEPGAIATAIWGKGDEAAKEFGPGHPARAHYAAEIDGLTKLAQQAARDAISAERVAEVMIASLNARRAVPRILIGRDAKLFALLKHWLPHSWFDALLLRAYGVASLPVRPAPAGNAAAAVA